MSEQQPLPTAETPTEALSLDQQAELRGIAELSEPNDANPERIEEFSDELAGDSQRFNKLAELLDGDQAAMAIDLTPFERKATARELVERAREKVAQLDAERQERLEEVNAKVSKVNADMHERQATAERKAEAAEWHKNVKDYNAQAADRMAAKAQHDSVYNETFERTLRGLKMANGGDLAYTKSPELAAELDAKAAEAADQAIEAAGLAAIPEIGTSVDTEVLKVANETRRARVEHSATTLGKALQAHDSAMLTGPTKAAIRENVLGNLANSRQVRDSKAGARLEDPTMQELDRQAQDRLHDYVYRAAEAKKGGDAFAYEVLVELLKDAVEEYETTTGKTMNTPAILAMLDAMPAIVSPENEPKQNRARRGLERARDWMLNKGRDVKGHLSNYFHQEDAETGEQKLRRGRVGTVAAVGGFVVAVAGAYLITKGIHTGGSGGSHKEQLASASFPKGTDHKLYNALLDHGIPEKAARSVARHPEDFTRMVTHPEEFRQFIEEATKKKALPVV